MRAYPCNLACAECGRFLQLVQSEFPHPAIIYYHGAEEDGCKNAGKRYAPQAVELVEFREPSAYGILAR